MYGLDATSTWAAPTADGGAPSSLPLSQVRTASSVISETLITSRSLGVSDLRPDHTRLLRREFPLAPLPRCILGEQIACDPPDAAHSSAARIRLRLAPNRPCQLGRRHRVCLHRDIVDRTCSGDTPSFLTCTERGSLQAPV